MFFKKFIEDGLSTEILSVSRLAGGDINEVYLIDTAGGRYVLKSNRSETFPKMFEKEAKGLNLLGRSGVLTPAVIDQFERDGQQYLLLDYIEEDRPGNGFWSTFGEGLSSLHQNSQAGFGLDYDNYIGSLVQKNEARDSWGEFFLEMRLNPLVRKGFDKGLLDRGHLEMFKGFYNRFSDLVPPEDPALLHGDLWSGNLLCGKGQKPVFIDPAVYFGHREVDIAMTFMFGGFDRTYLRAYQEQFPLEEGWEERISIHNLYPNLVHLNLFGSAYLGNIVRVIRPFR